MIAIKSYVVAKVHIFQMICDKAAIAALDPLPKLRNH
jgi:hypothetical protein